jgi:U1 small nuclear ribonucleoprotein
MKTIFVGNLSYTAREKHLKREFEAFGPVRKVKIIKDIKNDNKPKGYAFIEYESKRDFISKLKFI